MVERVVLSDRMDALVHPFTFGATMEPDLKPHEVVFVSRSTMPIVEMTGLPGASPISLAVKQRC
jgi:hypothetical protein